MLWAEGFALASHVSAEWSLASSYYADGSATDVSGLPSLAAQAPFRLPGHFTTFINSPSLHRRIRSCTACILELSDFPVFTGSARDGLIIQFLVDQQEVLNLREGWAKTAL